MRTFFRIFRFAGEGIVRNGWLALATTTMLTLTLFTVNIMLVLNLVSQAALSALNNELSVDIYFNAATTPDTQSSVRGYLLSLPQVRDVKTIPAAQSLDEFKNTFQSNDTILSALTEIDGNPFTDSVRVYAKDGKDLPFILSAVKSPEFSPQIRQTVTHEALLTSVKTLNERAAKLQLAGMVVAALFALIAMLTVFNTIRVAIYVHRDEISVMRLVGAHNSFIRGPFIIEAAIYSVVATAVVAGVMLGGLSATEHSLGVFLSGIPINLAVYFRQHALQIFGLEFIGLFFLAGLTTVLALRRYLRA